MATPSNRDLTRRDLLKKTLRAGVYAAPVILSVAAVNPVAAATSLGPFFVSFGQDALLTGAGAGATFDVYYTASNEAPGTFHLLGSFMTDAFGFGGTIFALTLDSANVTSVKLTYVLTGNPPTNAAAIFTSTLIAGLAPVNGARGPATLAAIVVQEPTVQACQVGPLNRYNEYVDAALLNATPNTAYDIYAQPNTLGAPVKVTTATTNAQGNVTVLMPVLMATVTASAVVVSVVLAGGSPSAPLLTTMVSGANLTTIPCSALASVSAAARAVGIAHR
ncbi:MAG: hypothetical protein ACYDAR_14355, partial [Thermomicrobiales bacterium]